jgi:hypothetical protein
MTPSPVNPTSSVKQDVSYTLWVYKTLCEKPLAKYYPCTMVRRTEGLHSLDVVRVKWYFTVNSPDKRNTDLSGIFFHKHSPYLGVRTYGDWAYFAHLREYHTPLKPVTIYVSTTHP